MLRIFSPFGGFWNFSAALKDGAVPFPQGDVLVRVASPDPQNRWRLL
jgi:hypothetical protein